MKNKIAIFGIDNFSTKNINQLNCLKENGYELDVFTNDSLGNSKDNLQSKNCYILEQSFFRRLKQVFKYLKNNEKYIHHIEIYPGGRFSFIYILIGNILKTKSTVVERGDLYYYDSLDFITKFSMRFCYKYSNLVWYRETYPDLNVEEKLTSFKVKKLYFIPNSIMIKSEYSLTLNKKYDFLWVNSLKKFRKPFWFANSLKNTRFKNTKNNLLGFINDANDENIKHTQNNIKSLKLDNLTIHSFVDPEEYYLNSKFFILASDLVFLNNSLLEAMSYGLVPLISNVEGSEFIVNDGVDGLIFEHSKDGLKKAMERALSLTDEEYRMMSKNAVQKVKENFSCEVWCKKYIRMIEDLNNV